MISLVDASKRLSAGRIEDSSWSSVQCRWLRTLVEAVLEWWGWNLTQWGGLKWAWSVGWRWSKDNGFWGYGVVWSAIKPSDSKSWRAGKDPNAGKDWRHKEKVGTEDEMVRYHHQLNGHKFEQTPGDSRGQRSLVCCSPWGCKDSDTLSNWTAANFFAFFFGVLLHLLKFYPVPFAS